MLAILHSTTDSLTAVLAGAAATTNPTYAVRSEVNGQPRQTDGSLGGSTAVTIAPAPAAGVAFVNEIIVCNVDTAAVTLTLKKNSTTLAVITLQSGDVLVWNEQLGLVVVDSGGQGRGTTTPAQLAAITAGTGAASKAVVLDTNKDFSGIRNLTMVGGGVRMAVQTVAAAGSVIGDAAALIEGGNEVTAANDAKGVILPVAVAGMVVHVKSTVSNKILKVWPQTGAAINAISASNPISLASGPTPALFWAFSATQWYTLPLLPS